MDTFLYFMDEKVGYEEYTWQSDEQGYLLEASGRMTKPVALEITKLSLRLDKSFIPRKFYFKGYNRSDPGDYKFHFRR